MVLWSLHGAVYIGWTKKKRTVTHFGISSCFPRIGEETTAATPAPGLCHQLEMIISVCLSVCLPDGWSVRPYEQLSHSESTREA